MGGSDNIILSDAAVANVLYTGAPRLVVDAEQHNCLKHCLYIIYICLMCLELTCSASLSSVENVDLQPKVGHL